MGTKSRGNETCLVHVEIQCIYHGTLSISPGFFPLDKLLIILNAGNFRGRTIKTPSKKKVQKKKINQCTKILLFTPKM